MEITKKGLKILLVEDEPIVMMVHCTMLRNLGYIPDTAVTGKEALEKVINGYDLIFMDIGLPDMSGIEVTKEIRRHEDPITKTKIIALTGYKQEEIHLQCYEVGMDGVLLKPTDEIQFENILQKFKTL
jgi:two-component system, OmpR family, aerobic respiration control sensor histidine kinase ArcB